MKTIGLISIEDTSEPIRQALEYMGYFVGMHKIGRPQHFIDILSGKTPCAYDSIVINCHGDGDGKIIMPKLHESVYFSDEPCRNFGFKEINQYMQLQNKLIVSTGCSTGNEALVKAFTKNCNTYIAPVCDPNGSSAMIYICLLFYHINFDRFNIEDAHSKASSIDVDTKMFTLFK